MSSDFTDISQVRLAQSQSLFRSVNERVEKVTEQFANGGPMAFVCECADPGCASQIELTTAEYETIRGNSTHFLVLAGHVDPEVETVVGDHGRYVIVEKFGVAGRVAKVADARMGAGAAG